MQTPHLPKPVSPDDPWGDSTSLPQFYECGICGAYHPATWDGDCREDRARLEPEDLNEQYGWDGWEEIAMPDGVLPEDDAPLTRFGPVVNGEQFAPGYTPEAAAYEQRIR